MDIWMLMEKKGESSFKMKDYDKACDYYKEALADIENRFDVSKPELKSGAAKITSNISMMYLKSFKGSNDETVLLQAKLYANKTIKYNPDWVKVIDGYKKFVKK